MKQVEIKIRQGFDQGAISPRLFGSFVEHMGSVVYSGIYEPDHPSADNHGFRQDVLTYVKDLSLGVIRYPGGNFTSGYNWLDTIGPVEERPRKVELAWQGIEPNTFGLHEFFQWIKQIDVEPILTVNLGTKGISEAQNLVEYCNFPEGTYWSDRRKKNGQEHPFDVKLWCLGNELDGPWQIGAKSAYEYGRLANEAAKAMKLVDDSIETILVGSSTPLLQTYPEWDRIALEQAYENVDYIALHNYIDKYDEEDLTKPPKKERDDTPTYLAKAYRFDRQIDEIIATCDYVKGYLRSEKTMYLAFDEWNVHGQPEKVYQPFEVGSPIDWCHFTMEDTLLFGTLGLAILRHADRVKIACQSLLVNTIPLILTEKGGIAWLNPTYYVMQHLATYAKGHVLDQRIVCPTYDCEKVQDVPVVDSVIVVNDIELVIFLVNRTKEASEINLHHDFCLAQEARQIVLKSQNLLDKNTIDTPHVILPKEEKVNIGGGNRIEFIIEGYSWNVIRIKKCEEPL
ncbi:alpha-N-arabinofuranosidase [Enterococcus sp. 10A9_DIV0425]|uniref:non-reducing end alpha-L-arabinofuranosidase n=1 Tax=Candidatus Enterococcus wittei TaxID=1987383 RepID=A0A242JY84_9ENTE|nr:alpha-L-arabinofuranosidase C-terminal domain-containing protein [Enterococcus sp. 10A9_DIV0425]OTP10284.1 alpha-N-arabinofuranosidase [Enterococcus sp. 10A9_DIV0425]